MTNSEIVKSALKMMAEILKSKAKDSELRYVTEYGTIVVRLIDDDSSKLKERIKDAQDSVPTV